MADTKTSPVLAPGAELKHLEDILDATSKKKGSAKDLYESQLEGWSPSPGASAANDAAGSMERLSLGPSAAAAATTADVPPTATDNAVAPAKQLTKAERKQLAAAAFAAKGGVAAAPKREKLTKQERRALQEAQRATRDPSSAASASSTPSSAFKKPDGAVLPATTATTAAPSGVRLQYDDAKRVAKRSKASIVVRTQAQKHVPLFSHLPQYERESSLSLNVGFHATSEIHAAVLALGLQYADGQITGGNARAVAMLTAFQHVVRDYVTPPNKLLRRDLDKALKPQIQYLIDCRPHCVSMGNAIRSLRSIVSHTPASLSDDDAKKFIVAEIDEFIQSRIVLAMNAVAKHAATVIHDHDVVLTYARSNVVEATLLAAHAASKRFRVVVVDARPHFEGTRLVKRLADAGLACTYVHIHALAYIMRDVTKVLLGASAFMSNGVAVSRVGTALVAMHAHEANVPVLFCCETYKFSDRVQLDAITHNELRDPDELVTSARSAKRAIASSRSRTDDAKTSSHVLSDWRDLPLLKLLNLVYDVTPIEYVSMVVTELGMVPPTSIPAILREYSRDGLVDVA